MDTKMNNLARTRFNGVLLVDEPISVVLEVIRRKLLKGTSYIVTPNADHFYRLDDGGDVEFINAYENADILVCDSRIIQKLSHLESKSITNVVPGSDLTRMILESDWVKSFDLLLVGPDSHEVDIVKAKYSLPLLQGYTPPMGFIKSETEVLKCIDVINSSQADIVFLAIGSPQQELLADRVKRTSGNDSQQNTVILCVGASFDFLSGKTKRAPDYIQKMHLEWLHRVLSNPARLAPRYWRNFLWIINYIFRKKTFTRWKQ